MKKSPLRRFGKRGRKQYEECHPLFLELLEEQRERKGYTYCEICGLWGQPDHDSSWRRLAPHHRDKNRRNNVKENLMVAHDTCHSNKHHGGMAYKIPSPEKKYIIGVDSTSEE